MSRVAFSCGCCLGPRRVIESSTAVGSPLRADQAASKDLTVIRVDITCDLMDEDETGHVWTFLSEAREGSLVEPGAIVVAGDPDAPVVAEVIDIVDKPAGKVVHLRILPGSVEEYEALIRRAITST